MKKNLNNYLTAKDRKYPSRPIKFLHLQKLIYGKVLDYGSGYGKDVEYLKSNGFEAINYDSYYQPNKPNEKFDTIVCIYVLNVLLADQQTEVLMDVSEMLKPGGVAYFVVRRDLKYVGFRMHKIHKKETFQCNVVLPFESIEKNNGFEIYRYKHFDFSNENSSCPFCNLSREPELITESALAFSMKDGFPVSGGHSLIIPKIHVSDYFELDTKYQQACNIVLNRTKKIIQEKYSPDGFNVGINIGEFGGQTIPHVHIHLIPRYKGDVENPRGGVRGVIPHKQNY